MSAEYLAFHPNPKKPDLAVPKGAVDAHCHVFGPAATFPFARQRSYTPVDASKEQLRALHDHLGFERAVVVQASCHGTDNAALVDSLESSGGKYRGIAMVKPDVEDAELSRLDAAGVRGSRFNFVKHLGSDAALEALNVLSKRYGALGWHVVIYFDTEKIHELAPVIADLPVPVVIDHMGRVDPALGLDQPGLALLKGLLAARKDIWVKVSGSERLSHEGPPFTDVVPLARHLVESFPDQVLWGTDWPHPNMKTWVPDDGQLVDLLGEIAPDPALLQKLLVDNPMRLYWPEEG
ncbi:amidohydrolase [Breoghania sp. L-A4]|nr:amidohydrolase [Breoghania sp. L-A4]